MIKKRLQVMKNGQGKNKGFTLIELLTSVGVVSVGILGAASLQIVTTQSNFEASQRIQATSVANAVIDRIRANPTKVSDYVNGDLGGLSISSQPSGCTSSMTEEACRSAVAAYDRWEIEQIVDNSDSLVSPRVCIEQVQQSTPDGPIDTNLINVTVAWRGMAKRGGGTADSLANCDSATVSAIDADYRKQVNISVYIACTIATDVKACVKDSYL